MIFKIGDNAILETIDWGFEHKPDKNLLRINNMKLVIEEDLSSGSISAPVSVTPISKDWYMFRD